MRSRMVVCWFVTKITKKLLSRFPRNFDGGWVSAQNRPNYILVGIGNFFPLLSTLHFLAIFLNFSENNTCILMEKKQKTSQLRWLGSVSDCFDVATTCGGFKSWSSSSNVE